jgi:dienelactone hydrolase
MRLRRIAAGLALIFTGLATPCGAAEMSRVVQEALKLESGGKVYDVAVFRPNDDARHPAIVYLHGGGFSFEDPLMVRFNTELAKRGLVVVAPHWLVSGSSAKDWQTLSKEIVTFAASLPNADPEQIGMSGISLGGQLGLSAAARDRRIKAVAEFFTSWPGSLPDEPIADLPKVLLLNGTADPIIPVDWATMLDGILKERGMPFERKMYRGVGHGFSTAASFNDAVVRTAVFFGGTTNVTGSSSITSDPATRVVPIEGQPGSSEMIFGFEDEYEFVYWSTMTRSAAVVSKKKRRPLVTKPAALRQVASPSRLAKP